MASHGLRPKYVIVETEGSREFLSLDDIVELCGPLPIVPPQSEPRTFAHVLHRETALPVIDLATLLGRARTSADESSAYAIVDIDGRRCALAVERVTELSPDTGQNRAVELRPLLAPLPLAKPVKETADRQPKETGRSSRYLLVELAGQTCGFDLTSVVHLYSERQFVRTPRIDGSLIVGVVAIGGRVLPVLNLATRLGLSINAASENFVELSLPEGGGGTFVVAVERISGIATIAQKALSQPADSQVVDAVAQVGSKSVWIVTPALIAKQDTRGRDGS